jgi:hypothetical protein
MVPNRLVRILLFCSSYLPMVPLFCLLYWDAHPRWAIGLIIFGVFVLGVNFFYFGILVPSMNTTTIRVSEVQDRSSDLMAYLASYILPFVSFTLDTWKQILAILFTLCLFGYVYVSSMMIHINPTLHILFGLHLYDVTIEGRQNQHFSLLARHRPLASNQDLWVIDVGYGIFIEKKATKTV